MARECRRLLVAPGRLNAAGLVSLEPDESHYLRRVLRLRPGDRLELVDGAGRLWSALLEPGEQVRLEQPLAAPLLQEPVAVLPLEVLVVPPRRDADVLLRMLVELGIDRITLLRSQRRVAPPTPAGRAATIVREACEQSERLWLPRMELDQGLAEALGSGASAALPRLLATTRRAGVVPLGEVLAAEPGPVGGRPAGVRLAVGPEGGWSPEEEALALDQGWKPVSLGRGILRTSTAAVAAATLLSAWRITCCGTGWRPSP